MEFFLNLLSWP